MPFGADLLVLCSTSEPGVDPFTGDSDDAVVDCHTVGFAAKRDRLGQHRRCGSAEIDDIFICPPP